jgi:hypothetical protein
MMNIKEVKRVFKAWIPSDGFPIGHPIHEDELEADFRFLFDQFDNLLEDVIYYAEVAKTAPIDRTEYLDIEKDLKMFRELRNKLHDPN